MRRLVKKVSFFGYDFSDFKMNVLFALVALIGGIVIAGIVLAVYDLSKKGFPIAGCALLSFFAILNIGLLVVEIKLLKELLKELL